ncbi:hypothetical protein [Candidatus Methanoperedens nitratireducens]|uniref:Uncharacterized protein n=1 Tax=Candidatus Methanoperedens nitratireducens TaxID=1392998 RepID=A0A284VK97_9EURY|nr:hypothetical protein [Candidatus Methanoperedens nitroreducens]SNQ59673.1 hypothetical protein MNV_1270003 [Candidatus Methanoperedens nitroreducens]
MVKTNQKDCINVKFGEGLDIFDDVCRYPVIDEQENSNRQQINSLLDRNSILFSQNKVDYSAHKKFNYLILE